MIPPTLTEAMRPNVVDRVVSFFAPVAAANRMKARAAMAIAGVWSGGSLARRQTSMWITGNGSADADNEGDRKTLMARSRDLVRNAPIAGAAIGTTVTSTVGTGLVLKSTIDRQLLGLDEDQAKVWQSKTEREFRLWANSKDADVTRHMDFFELQDLVLRATLESGDAFTLLPMVQRRGSVYDLRVQVLEADRVCNKNYGMDTVTLVGGVERDAYGAPVAYHVADRHPGDFLALTRGGGIGWTRVAAFGARTGRRNMLHHFVRLRPDQSRGIPMLAPVIEPLKQLDRYTEAEIMAAVISSMFTVFVESPNPLEDALGSAGATSAGQSAKDFAMGSGAILDLQPGEKVQFANPGRPNPAFDPFVQAIYQKIGARLEIPHEVLLKHFNSSYSAARAALMEAWRFFKSRRAWLVSSFCQPVFEAWLEEAVAKGRVVAPGFFQDPALRMAYCGASWIGDSPGQIDPLKEVLAAKERIALEVSNLGLETPYLTGEDWDTVHEGRAQELARQREDGTLPAPGAPAPSAPMHDANGEPLPGSPDYQGAP